MVSTRPEPAMDTNPEAAPKPALLLVEDEPMARAQITAILRPHYQVQWAESGVVAMAMLGSGQLPDLILLDIGLPGQDGMEVLGRLKSYPLTRDIPVIFLTARQAEEDERLGLEAGAVDYIHKPPSAPILLARVRNHLQLKEARDLLKDRSVQLQLEASRRIRELADIQEATLVAMASQAESRDSTTVNHIRRTQHAIRILAEQARNHPRFAPLLDDETLDLLYKASPLHDLGKLSIPDWILLKPGTYTPDEFENMKRHCAFGKEALEAAERQLPRPVRFLAVAKEIAYCHHEKWNGTGYPQGLAGEAIPLPARLMAVVDVYDSLTRRRIHTAARSHEAALDVMIEGREVHFDPDLLDAFLQAMDRIRAVADRFPDTDADLARIVQGVRERKAPGA
jgi:putative two-component system response regulator